MKLGLGLMREDRVPVLFLWGMNRAMKQLRKQWNHWRKFVKWHLDRFIFASLDQLRSKATPARGCAIVRLDAIGDFVIWLPEAPRLKPLAAGEPFILVANAAWADLARSTGLWDEVIAVDVRRFRTEGPYRGRITRDLRRVNFRLVVHPTRSRSLWYSDWLMLRLRAAQKIGVVNDKTNMSESESRWSDPLYTRLIPNMAEFSAEHSVNRLVTERVCACPAPYMQGHPLSQVEPPDYALPFPRYAVIAPSASSNHKIWPIEHFTALCERIVGRYQIPVTIIGGATDVPLGDAIAAALPHAAVNLCGKTNLMELTRVIQGASLFVGNDSGPLHIAAAMNVPSIVILGGGHFGRFLPYDAQMAREIGATPPLVLSHPMDCFNCDWRCKFTSNSRETVPCIANIPTQQVWSAIEGIFAGIQPGQATS